MGLWGYGLTFFILLAMMEAAANMNSNAPYWYEMLRNLVTQAMGRI